MLLSELVIPNGPAGNRAVTSPKLCLGEVGARVKRGSGRGRFIEVGWFVALGPLPNLALAARFDLPQLRRGEVTRVLTTEG